MSTLRTLYIEASERCEQLAEKVAELEHALRTIALMRAKQDEQDDASFVSLMLTAEQKAATAIGMDLEAEWESIQHSRIQESVQ